MQALIDGSEEIGHCTAQSAGSMGDRPTLDDLEERYRRARLRLLTAQEEKTSAVAEFVAARADLRRTLEAVWPDPS